MADEPVLRLPDPVFAEGTGVLEMMAEHPDGRRPYNERLKAARPEWGGQSVGSRRWCEGLTLIGRIPISQDLSGFACQSAGGLSSLNFQ